MSPPAAIRVGGEVDASCNKCQLNLAHTILAMVGPKIIKVRCNTCMGEHQYRGIQPLQKAASFARPKAKPAAARVPKSERVLLGFQEQLAEKDTVNARPYSPRSTFAVDDVVDHPTFGRGFVVAVRGDKIDLTFKAMEKTLVHGKASPAPAEPASTES